MQRAYSGAGSGLHEQNDDLHRNAHELQNLGPEIGIGSPPNGDSIAGVGSGKVCAQTLRHMQ